MCGCAGRDGVGWDGVGRSGMRPLRFWKLEDVFHEECSAGHVSWDSYCYFGVLHRIETGLLQPALNPHFSLP